MSLIEMLERRGNPLENPSTSFTDPSIWDALGGLPTASGEKVDETSALTIGAYYAGVRFISETIGSLPVKLYRRLDRGKELLRDDPRFQLVNYAPNPEMTGSTFREVCQGHLCTWGNTYSEIVRDAKGDMVELWPVPPSVVTKKRDRNGRIVFEFLTSDGAVTLPADKVLHIPGFGYDGMIGYSPVSLAREDLGRLKAGGTAASQLFGNGLQASGVLTPPGDLTEKTRANLRKSIDAQSGASGRQRVLILEGGLKFEQMGLAPGDAQFLESRQFDVVEVARWLDLPPHILKDLTHATYTNIEQQSLELVTLSLRRWFVRWEQHLDFALLRPEERGQLFFKVEDRALLRGDTASRGEFYRTMFNAGAYSPNDILELEDENTYDGGDTKFIPVNMMPVEQAAAMTANSTEPMLSNSFDAWARDAWSGVVRGEIREVRKTVKRGDPLEGYYVDSFVRFATSRLAPLFRAAGRTDVEEVVAAYAADSLVTLSDVTAEQVNVLLDDWTDRGEIWAGQFSL